MQFQPGEKIRIWIPIYSGVVATIVHVNDMATDLPDLRQLAAEAGIPIPPPGALVSRYARELGIEEMYLVEYLHHQHGKVIQWIIYGAGKFADLQGKTLHVMRGSELCQHYGKQPTATFGMADVAGNTCGLLATLHPGHLQPCILEIEQHLPMWENCPLHPGECATRV